MTTPFPGEYAGAADVAVDSKGRTVAVGTANPTSAGDSQLIVVRYMRSGKLDRSFSKDGIVRIGSVTDPDPGYTFDRSSADALLIDPRGRIVVCGQAAIDAPQDGDFLLMRFNPSGKLDGSFGDDGVQTTGFGSPSDVCEGLALDGTRIVAAGETGDGAGLAVARYTSAGRLDESFAGVGGEVVGFHGFAGNDEFGGVAVDKQRHIVLAGQWDGGPSGTTGDILRLNPNGSSDSSFHGNGEATIRLASGSGIDGSGIGRLAIDRDGRYVVSATVYLSGDPLSEAAIARVTPRGKLDKSFGGDGVVTTKEPTIGYGVDVALDGKRPVLMVQGGSSAYTDYARLYRFTPKGKPDPEFDSKKLRYVKDQMSFGGAMDRGGGKRYVVAGQVDIRSATADSIELAAARVHG